MRDLYVRNVAVFSGNRKSSGHSTGNFSGSGLRSGLFMLLCAVFCMVSGVSFAQTTVTFTTPGSTTWPVPPGVTSITIETWGGGGGGGGARTNASYVSAASAGGGGGYARTTITVNPGDVMNIEVGAQGSAGVGANAVLGGSGYTTTAQGAGGAGGTSSVTFGTLLLQATGGVGGRASGAGSTLVGGTGGTGTVFSGTGTATYNGGDGSGGRSNGSNGVVGGAGGGGAGTGASGATGEAPPASGKSSALVGGNGGAAGGGKGGNGGHTTSTETGSGGQAGSGGAVIGGGGGGAVQKRGNTNRDGGAGGRGEVRITYTVSCTSPATPSAISGGATLCAGASGTYTVTNDPSATSYTWTLPGGWTGSSTTNSISATAGASGGTITVTANNACGSSTAQTLTVTSGAVPAQPSAISGNTTLCNGASGTYSVTNNPSATSYTWTLPGSWSGTSTTNSINATAGASGGTITVTANNACGSSTAQTLTVTPGAVPAQPSAISGNTTLCNGASGTYSVTNNPSATSYAWTLPGGWTGSSTTNSISATAGASGGTITVTANNACGSSTAQTLTVTSGAVPAQPSAISGNTTLCAGASDTYSVTNDPAATGYTWTLPGSWTGSSTTNSINATAGASGGTITVTANNACGSSTAQTLTVTPGAVPAQPSAISGNPSLCNGASDTYSVTNDPSATGYTWTLPGSWSGTSTTNSINATAGASGGTITVTANNACGSSTAQTLTVTPGAVPAQPSAISGNPSLCNGASDTYSVTNDPSATGYTWTLPGSWSGTSTTNSINATAGASGGTITVTANNACGSSTAQTLTVTPGAVPAQPSAISGNTTLCAGASDTYSVTNDPSATGYTWTLPGSWTGSSTTNSISATAGASGGTITVTADNACGSSTPQTLAVTAGTAPLQPSAITGNVTLCNGDTDTYTVPNDPAATGYTWTLPGSWTGSSTTNSINATAGASGGTITVTANNACGSSTAQTLTVTPGAVPAQPGTITGTATLCSGASDTYSVPNDPAATSYTWTLPGSWTGSSTSNSINATAGASGGTITVTAHNACGSSTVQTLAVTAGTAPVQPAAISGNGSLCNGTSGTYSVVNDPSATGYTWTLPGSWTGSSTTNSISATAGASGGTITVTAHNACGSSTSQTLPVTVSVATSSTINHAFCTSYTVNGQTYTAAGTYTQQLTNAAGCDSTITIHLTNASPGSTIYRVACNSYVWNSQTYTQTGTYTQQFTNSAGCDSTVTLHLTINQLDMSVTQNGHILTANEHGASYQWLNCDNGNSVIVGAVGQTFTASSNGNYAVVVSKNACTDTSACYQVLSASLYEIDFSSLFTVYPNPSNGFYSIASSQFLYDVQLRVYSLTGQLVYSQSDLYGETLMFDISNQNTGVYILEIRSGDRVSHIKLMKQ